MTVPFCFDQEKNESTHDSLESVGWYCLQTKTKHEHLTAAALNAIPGVATLSPRIRFQKKTRRGNVWFVESIFPGYVFAHFNYITDHRRVLYSGSVIKIVQFGRFIPRIDPLFIDYLRTHFFQDEVIHIDPKLGVGENVTIVEGPLSGLEALVTKVMPSKTRISILLDFFGRQIHAEVNSAQISKENISHQHPLSVLT